MVLDGAPATAWQEEELIPISALEHWSYCPRQCGLIHLEQTYDENIYTLRGKRAHDRVHTESAGVEEGVRIVRGQPLWSDRLGLIGKADIVEWHGEVPFPVEYKVGRARGWQHEIIQLCAQAMCLEEMLDVNVPAGAIYHVSSRRRQAVVFTDQNRRSVVEMTSAIRQMMLAEKLPAAVNDARCPNCSLVDACTPGIASRPAVIRGHYAELFHPREP